MSGAMEFELTTHAKKMIAERKVPNPNGRALRIPGKNRKKKIRQACPVNGYKNPEFIYWIENRSPFPVYVCKVTGVGSYKVITVFWIK